MNTKKNKKRPKVPKRKKRKEAKSLSAKNADPMKLYEESVQNTEASIDLIDTAFKNEGRDVPLQMREDFCGTAKLCSDWVLSHPKRRAVGLDIDKPTLLWAAENNIRPLGRASSRVTLLEQNVLDRSSEQYDVISAFNFSYWIFRSRDQLKTYFNAVYRSLKPGGMFIIDAHGGPDSQFILEEETKHDDFIYVWDQESFDPVNNRVVCHIHFRFYDGTELEKAFTYDWRIWSLPELRDLMEEVGFSRVDTWWDDEDDVIRPRESAENLVSWIAYLAAWR